MSILKRLMGLGSARPWHRLGDDVDEVAKELRSRRNWKVLPESVISSLAANATYVFRRPGEGADSLKRLVFLLEDSPFFPGRLQETGASARPAYELCVLSGHLYDVGSELAKCVLSDVTHVEAGGKLAIADSAVCGSLVCERYALCSYYLLARLSFSAGGNKKEAMLWCGRLRRAETDLRSERESDLTFLGRAMKETLDVDRAELGRLGEELQSLAEHVPALRHSLPSDVGDCPTLKEMREELESAIRSAFP